MDRIFTDPLLSNSRGGKYKRCCCQLLPSCLDWTYSTHKVGLLYKIRVHITKEQFADGACYRTFPQRELNDIIHQRDRETEDNRTHCQFPQRSSNVSHFMRRDLRFVCLRAMLHERSWFRNVRSEEIHFRWRRILSPTERWVCLERTEEWNDLNGRRFSV